MHTQQRKMQLLTCQVTLIHWLLPMPTESVSMGSMFDSVCLSVAQLKTNDPKVFKLGVSWDIVEMMWFWG